MLCTVNRLGQVSAELRELVAADRTFHVEGRKGIMETIDARLETLSNYVVETDKKLTQALSRMMDASGVHMRKIAKSQTENATSLVEKQNKDLLAKMAALEKKNIQLLRDLYVASCFPLFLLPRASSFSYDACRQCSAVQCFFYFSQKECLGCNSFSENQQSLLSMMRACRYFLTATSPSFACPWRCF